jgi:hypothetical protein
MDNLPSAGHQSHPFEFSPVRQQQLGSAGCLSSIQAMHIESQNSTLTPNPLLNHPSPISRIFEVSQNGPEIIDFSRPFSIASLDLLCVIPHPREREHQHHSTARAADYQTGSKGIPNLVNFSSECEECHHRRHHGDHHADDQ